MHLRHIQRAAGIMICAKGIGAGNSLDPRSFSDYSIQRGLHPAATAATLQNGMTHQVQRVICEGGSVIRVPAGLSLEIADELPGTLVVGIRHEKLRDPDSFFEFRISGHEQG